MHHKAQCPSQFHKYAVEKHRPGCTLSSHGYRRRSEAYWVHISLVLLQMGRNNVALWLHFMIIASAALAWLCFKKGSQLCEMTAQGWLTTGERERGMDSDRRLGPFAHSTHNTHSLDFIYTNQLLIDISRSLWRMWASASSMASVVNRLAKYLTLNVIIKFLRSETHIKATYMHKKSARMRQWRERLGSF